MPKVPVAQQRDIDAISREALQVTSLAVDRTNPCLPVLVVSVGVFFCGEPDGHRYELALSPPAAKQLSRDLRKAVKEYLRSVPEEENQA